MPRFSEAERVVVWDRWRAGDGYRLIGRDLGRSAGSVRVCGIVGWGSASGSETVVSAFVV